MSIDSVRRQKRLRAPQPASPNRFPPSALESRRLLHRSATHPNAPGFSHGLEEFRATRLGPKIGEF
jgi:hypothetical protein